MLYKLKPRNDRSAALSLSHFYLAFMLKKLAYNLGLLDVDF